MMDDVTIKIDNLSEEQSRQIDTLIAETNRTIRLLKDKIVRLEARQITPEMDAVWGAYQAMASEARRTDTIVYPEEMRRFQADLWQAFAMMMGEG